MKLSSLPNVSAPSLPERVVWSAVGVLLRALQRLTPAQWIEVRRALLTIVRSDDAATSRAGLDRLVTTLEKHGLIESDDSQN